jgi:hypothetical protein
LHLDKSLSLLSLTILNWHTNNGKCCLWKFIFTLSLSRLLTLSQFSFSPSIFLQKVSDFTVNFTHIRINSSNSHFCALLKVNWGLNSSTFRLFPNIEPSRYFIKLLEKLGVVVIIVLSHFSAHCSACLSSIRWEVY